MRVGVHDAEAVRTDDPDPVPPGDPEQRAAARPGIGVTELRRIGREHDHDAHAVQTAVLDHRVDSRGGYGHHGQIDRLPDRAERGVRRQPGDRGRVRVDREDRAAEVAPQEVADHLVPDSAGRSSGADDGYRSRPKQGRQRVQPGKPLAFVAGVERCLVQGGDQSDVDDTGAKRVATLETRAVEHLEHAVVLRERVRDEAEDPVAAGAGREVLKQEGADALALVRVFDEQRDLGLFRRDEFVPGDADEDLAPEGDQDAVVLPSRADEAVDVTLGAGPREAEEAQVEAPIARPRHERMERIGVRRSDRPESDDGAVCRERLAARINGSSRARAWPGQRDELHEPTFLPSCGFLDRPESI